MNKCTLSLHLPDILTSNLEAPSIKWLLETSTDPEVFIAAASLVPLVEWPLDLDVSDMLHQLSDIFTSCVGFDGQIVPSLDGKASACIMAMSHLYCGRVLHAYPDRGELHGRGRTDFGMFNEMTWWNIGDANDTVLTTTMNLFLPEDENGGFMWYSLDDCPDHVTEWLSHCLPYHFVTGRVNQGIEAFAIKVISKRLSSPSSPSNQIIANCTLLACVMVGVQFDKKNIIRIDKSAALPQVTQSLLARFQSVLWAWDGGDLEKDSTGVTRRAYHLLNIICRILELAQSHYNPSFDTMRNLDVCKKIYSRAKSPDLSVSLSALPNALRFTLTASQVSRDPASLWTDSYSTGDSHSPEDFDWLVEYLDYIYSDDKEAAFDILLLMSLMEVRCSPAKQHQFFESLIACMGSNMPVHLRYAALRAARIVREEIVSIDTIDVNVRDMVLTKLSPAILTTVCPRPGTTLADDPHHFFHDDRDKCYLELIFPLARNSNWHPHLFGDHHIDRCISMVGEYCRSYSRHAFYLSGILFRIAPEQLSVPSLDAITEQQWWDMISSAWFCAQFVIGDIYCFESLPVLVEGTKRYMGVASEDGLERLVRCVDVVLDILEGRDSEQGEGESVTVTVKEFRAVASDMLEKLVNSKGVISS
ncbi:uncharacterized protein BJ212DRAFT_1588140 [Suillus subaureus]|uniref:Uncharacterized protein n=1 Tax=Suillus subaureus TaxID=48587 RepID=A0A9P7JCV4_9AGAM|nr:uncharacterized protein BJ212DRAFT_1588140 [Suillus subaureus]KAG1815201.1 hypothetical protein BJ212DRAFT_1588140 [Suillus subaureus]